MSQSSKSSPVYRENLAPPLWLLAFIYFLLASLSLSIWAALGNMPGALAIILSTLFLVLIRMRTTLHIEVSNGELRINRAHIEQAFLGEITQLDKERMRTTRGRDADPASFLAIRFWVSQGIKIQIQDPRDPTPYWLISTRKGKDLAVALGRALGN